MLEQERHPSQLSTEELRIICVELLSRAKKAVENSLEEAAYIVLVLYFLDLLSQRTCPKRLYEQDFNTLKEKDNGTWKFYNDLMGKTTANLPSPLKSDTEKSDIERKNILQITKSITQFAQEKKIRPVPITLFYTKFKATYKEITKHPFEILKSSFNSALKNLPPALEILQKEKPKTPEELASYIASLYYQLILQQTPTDTTQITDKLTTDAIYKKPNDDNTFQQCSNTFVNESKKDEQNGQIAAAIKHKDSCYRKLTAELQASLAVQTKLPKFATAALQTHFGSRLMGWFGRGPKSNDLTANQLIDILEKFADDKNIVNQILGNKGFFGGRNFWKVIRSDKKAMIRLLELCEIERKSTTTNNFISTAIRNNTALFSFVQSQHEFLKHIILFTSDEKLPKIHPNALFELLKQPNIISALELTPQQLETICKKTISIEDLLTPKFQHLLPKLPKGTIPPGTIDCALSLNKLSKEVRELFSLEESEYQLKRQDNNSLLRLFSKENLNSLRNRSLRQKDPECSSSVIKLTSNPEVKLNRGETKKLIDRMKAIINAAHNGLNEHSPGINRLFDGLPHDFDPNFKWIKDGILLSLNNNEAMKFFAKNAIIQGCATLFNSEGTLKDKIMNAINDGKKFNLLINDEKLSAWNLTTFLRAYLTGVFMRFDLPEDYSSNLWEYNKAMIVQKQFSNTLLEFLPSNTDISKLFKETLSIFKNEISETLVSLQGESQYISKTFYTVSKNILQKDCPDNPDKPIQGIWEDIIIAIKDGLIFTDETILTWQFNHGSEEQQSEFIYCLIDAQHRLHKQLLGSLPSVEDNVERTLSLLPFVGKVEMDESAEPEQQQRRLSTASDGSHDSQQEDRLEIITSGNALHSAGQFASSLPQTVPPPEHQQPSATVRA